MMYRAAWIENTSAATALPAVATAVYTLSHKAAKLMSQVTVCNPCIAMS
jgi:hypothetical protein